MLRLETIGVCVYGDGALISLPSGTEYIDCYSGVILALSFISNTLFPGGDSPVLTAVIAN